MVDFASGRMDTLIPSTVTIAGLTEVVAEARLLMGVVQIKIPSVFVALGVRVSLGMSVSSAGSTVMVGSSLLPGRGACATVSFV